MKSKNERVMDGNLCKVKYLSAHEPKKTNPITITTEALTDSLFCQFVT